MAKNPVLVVENLTKTFYLSDKSFNAVDDLSLQLNSSEILGMLGANGAGKTTTISMLLSTLTPTSGNIKYFNKDFFKHRSQILEHVSFASTYVKMPGDLTVKDNLDIFARIYGLSSFERQENIKNFLHFFDMWHLKDRPFITLSAGQATKVMIAKAFLTKPKVVLLDEPTASLDPDVALQMRKFIVDQRDKYNMSILLTSHNMTEVSQACDRVVVMQKGKLIADDTPQNLAASVTKAKIQLIISDGLDAAIKYAQEKYNYKTQGYLLEMEVDEQDISKVLQQLAHLGVHYSQISIAKPTLEDYFLQLAKASRL